MITLLASIAGFITSIIPEIIKIKKEKNDKEHELEIIDRQIEYSKTAQDAKFSELGIRQDISEFSALYSTYSTGILWIDALNGTVRPVLTYCFFSLYVYIKTLQYQYIISSENIMEYIQTIWTTDDQTIFAGIVSFYFGQRAFTKMHKSKKP